MYFSTLVGLFMLPLTPHQDGFRQTEHHRGMDGSILVRDMLTSTKQSCKLLLITSQERTLLQRSVLGLLNRLAFSLRILLSILRILSYWRKPLRLGKHSSTLLQVCISYITLPTFTYPKELIHMVISHVFHTSPSHFTYPKELSIHGHNTCILYIPIPLLIP